MTKFFNLFKTIIFVLISLLLSFCQSPTDVSNEEEPTFTNHSIFINPYMGDDSYNNIIASSYIVIESVREDSTIHKLEDGYTFEGFIFPVEYATPKNNDPVSWGYLDKSVIIHGIAGTLSLLKDGNLHWKFEDSDGSLVELQSQNTVSLEQWAHIAIGFNNTHSFLFIEGILEDSVSTIPDIQSDNNWADHTSFRTEDTVYHNPIDINIGIILSGDSSNFSFNYQLNAKLDEIRFSTILRYDTSYLVSSNPFESDNNTLMLFHFDDTTSVVNSSPNNSDASLGGVIYDNQWREGYPF